MVIDPHLAFLRMQPVQTTDILGQRESNVFDRARQCTLKDCVACRLGNRPRPPCIRHLPDGTDNAIILAMTTTIDKAGRLVVPKAVREASGLRPGTRVRFRVRTGRIEIEPVPLDVSLEPRGSAVVAVPREGRPVLTAAEVERTTSDLRSGASSASERQASE